MSVQTILSFYMEYFVSSVTLINHLHAKIVCSSMLKVFSDDLETIKCRYKQLESEIWTLSPAQGFFHSLEKETDDVLFRHHINHFHMLQQSMKKYFLGLLNSGLDMHSTVFFPVETRNLPDFAIKYYNLLSARELTVVFIEPSLHNFWAICV